MRRSLGALATAAGLAVLGGVLFSCSGGSLTVAVTAPNGATRADGTTPALITVNVSRGSTPVDDSAGGSVTASTDLGQFSQFDTSSGTPPDDISLQKLSQDLSSGSTRFQLYSLRTGTANLTFTYKDSNGASATKKATVVFGNGTPSGTYSIKFVSADPPVIQLANSGGVTQSKVTFEVDQGNSPAPNGVKVDFALSSINGGATIAPASATTANGSGLVSTIISAGTTPATVTVAASVNGGSPTNSGQISISGGTVYGGSLSASCDHSAFDGLSHDGLVLHCSIYSSDPNHKLIAGTLFNVATEAGTVTGPDSHPDQVIAELQSNGTIAANFIYSSTCPLPKDVAPNSGEFSASGCTFYNRCGATGPVTETRTCNQRDGIATLVVYTAGQECFNDLNHNGVFDTGEDDPKCDLPDPWIDADDDGHYGGGEYLIASSTHDGVWHDKNGHHDAQTTVWYSFKITWTGSPNPDPAAIGGHNPGRSGTSPEPNVGTMTRCIMNVQQGFSFPYPYADIFGNCPAGDGASDRIEATCNGSNCIDSTTSVTDCANWHPVDGGIGWVPLAIKDADACDCSSCLFGFNVEAHIYRTFDADGTSGETMVDGAVVKGAFSGNK